MSSTAEPQRVVAIAYDGLCTFEFGVATELFGLPRPELDVPWYEFEVVSVDTGPVRTLGGVSLNVPSDLSRLHGAGTIVLPGWRDPDEIPPKPLLDALRSAHEAGARLLSICSGVFVLAATGLLDGNHATTHWRYTNKLRAMYPRIHIKPDVLYVDNGTLLTSAGSAAGLDLGLHLIRRDFGQRVASQVARRLVVPPHRSGDQAQYIHAPVPESDTWSLSQTTAWALDNLAQPLTVAHLAEHACLGERTFARRFKAEVGVTPHHWLVQQRLLLAQHILESTDVGIDIVAQRSGFGSAANLRQRFKRAGLPSPSSYRASFTNGTGTLP